LFSPKCGRLPGPRGPEKELIDAVVEMKRRNPNWRCPRIAQQIALAFAVDIDKDIVRRNSERSLPVESGGLSRLTFPGNI
jgi:putative transposase